MTTVQVRPYEAQDSTLWDEWVKNADNGTFLHTRQFLSYHGNRFEDASLLIESDQNKLLGVFPAALDPTQPNRIISHPGITYGGIVHQGGLRGAHMLKALQQVGHHYQEAGIQALRYKVVPYIYHKRPAHDDLYALFRLGAKRYRCDLSSTIRLAHQGKISQNRLYKQRRAQRNGVTVETGNHYLEAIWNILQDNLQRKHDVQPVHTLAELKQIMALFPEHITCSVAKLQNEVVAGAIAFKAPPVLHGQYCCVTPTGQETKALRLLIEQLMIDGEEAGFLYFDFGISNEQEGTVLNEGLHDFKSSFGAGGVTYEFYEWDLSSVRSPETTSV